MAQNLFNDYYNNFRLSEFQCCLNENTGIVRGLRLWHTPMEYVPEETGEGDMNDLWPKSDL